MPCVPYHQLSHCSLALKNSFQAHQSIISEMHSFLRKRRHKSLNLGLHLAIPMTFIFFLLVINGNR